MGVTRSLAGSLLWLVEIASDLFLLTLFLRAVSSWVSADPGNPFYRLLIRVTEPVLAPLRRILPLQGGGFDFSPVAAFLAVWILQAMLTGLLKGLLSTH
jgi:YggT family protein